MTTLGPPPPNRRTPAVDAASSWVPQDACRLPSADVPMRLAAFDDLFATAVTGIERVEATRLRLVLTPDADVAATTAALAVREADCCGFFTFTLTAAADRLELDITVPEPRTSVLDGIGAQAATTLEAA